MVGESDLVGEVSHEENASSAILIYILLGCRVGEGVGIETITLVLHCHLNMLIVNMIAYRHFLFL